ncbi:hypothetical protein [Sinorhizobium saheli]|jgi:hypothetical protein|uniref:hypothetical protein n=1 Tax=Sinorhizobium saheli TaxID=36856 RepID=UPI000A5DB207|nr:hypothetical protein [Sinorhizobium saheli]
MAKTAPRVAFAPLATACGEKVAGRPDEDEIARAEEAARAVDGVADVINRIGVSKRGTG